MGGIGHGIVYISGLAYIHVRTTSRKHRVARLGLCHLGIAIGLTSTASYMSTLWGWTYLYYLHGHFIAWSAASALVLFLTNELLHGLGAYNYKKCLDSQLYEADQRKDRLWRALQQTNGGVSQRNWGKQLELSLLAIVSKVMSGFFYNNIFIILTIIAQQNITRDPFLNTILHYFMLAGVLLGIIVSLSAKIRVLFPMSLILSAITLVIAAACFTTQSYTAAAIFFWLFFLVAGMGVFMPDVTILEVSNPNFTEINLFLGFFIEQIPLVVSIYFVREELFNVIYDAEILWTNVGICAGFAVVIAIWLIFRYPNTFHLRVLEIQKLILFNETARTNADVAPTPYPQMAIQNAMHYNHQQQQQQHLAYAPGPAPGTMVAPPPPQGGYFSSQPIYPGQQPVYMVPQSMFNPSGSVQQPQPHMMAPLITTQSVKSALPSAPEQTPGTEGIDSGNWHQQQQPPSYGST